MFWPELQRHPRVWLFVCAWLMATGPAMRAQELQRPDPNRFEQDVRKLEETAAARGRVDVLFVGSSSIRLWNLQKSFPGMDLINHGFGGSHLADSTHFAARLIQPFRPRVVVFYAGDNDIAFGLSPQQVADDFADFSHSLHGALPSSRLIYISIKPSLARWPLFPRMREANENIRGQIESDSKACYLDVGPSMLGADGKPRGELFADDGLHLNQQGYALWAELLRPVLAKALDEARAESLKGSRVFFQP